MNSAQIHLALNHFPLVLVIVGTLVLAFALWRRQAQLRTLALMLFVGAAVAALPTYFSGEGTEEIVERMPGVTEAVIDSHEDAAGVTISLTLLLGAASMVGWIAMRGRDRLTTPVGVIVLAVGMMTMASIAWTAHLGGQIRHTEIRSGTTINLPPGGSDTD